MSDLNNLLFFGHDFNKPESNLFGYLNDNPDNSNKKILYTFNETKLIWETIIKDLLEINTSEIIVPLSGGLDSRLILAGLLQYISPKEITTFTYGPENSFDYNIGNRIAKEIGTNHFSKKILPYEFSYDNELYWSKVIKKPLTLFFRPPIEFVKKFEKETLWIGYMGDPIAGSHLTPYSLNQSQAIELYLNKYGLVEKKHAGSLGIDLERIRDNIMASVSLNNKIDHFENLDFSIRQMQYIKPHVVFSKKSALPFIDYRWISYFLSMPHEKRINTKYYKSFLLHSYPKLFQYPCKNNHGYALGSKKYIFRKILNRLTNQRTKYLNYIDFDLMLKSKTGLYHMVHNAVYNQNLIDPDLLMNKYEKGELTHQFLLNITSLKIQNII